MDSQVGNSICNWYGFAVLSSDRMESDCETDLYFFSYNLAFTVLFTGINLPYATLTALMTQDQYERSVLSIFRMILATCGTLFIKHVLFR